MHGKRDFISHNGYRNGLQVFLWVLVYHKTGPAFSIELKSVHLHSINGISHQHSFVLSLIWLNLLGIIFTFL